LVTSSFMCKADDKINVFKEISGSVLKLLWYLMATPKSKVLGLVPADWTGLQGQEFSRG